MTKLNVVDFIDRMDEVLNYKDPGLSDEKFERKLIVTLYSEDVAIRTGSTVEDYVQGTLKSAIKAVSDAVEKHGRGNRNQIITDAFNTCSNSKPINSNFAYRGGVFLEGSDYDSWAKSKDIVNRYGFKISNLTFDWRMSLSEEERRQVTPEDLARKAMEVEKYPLDAQEFQEWKTAHDRCEELHLKHGF